MNLTEGARRRGQLDPQWDRLLKQLGASWEYQQRVQIIGVSGHAIGADAEGYITSGGTVTVRVRASRATLYVQEHVQTDAAGEGGATYDTSNFKSSTEIDCRADRQQDRTITRGTGDHYYVWYIPVFKDGAGNTTKFDGVDGEDLMAFLDLGV